MYTFLHKKNNTLLSNFFFFKICKMLTFDQYVWLEITKTYTTKQSIKHILCELLCNDILSMNKTYRRSTFSVLLQLKDLISENMKISK